MSDLLRYTYRDRSREIHAEIVCRKHYDAQCGEGGFFAPLTEAEKRQGKSQTVTPYTGDCGCELCADDAEMQKVTGAA